MSYTTTDLIASVKRRASVPTSQSLFSASDFLAFANDEMLINLLPEILSVKEEYFVANYDVTVTSGQNAYVIPTRAIGGKLRDVQLISGSEVISLPRLFDEDRTSVNEGRQGFYLENNNVVISPTPTNSSDILRLRHFRRPNTLVATTSCGQIESIDTDNNQVVVSLVPSTFASGRPVDFVKGTAGFECLAIDQEINAVGGSTITFDSLPSGLAVGDWVALAGETPIPQVPIELHSVLAQMVAVKLLEAMADPKMTTAEQKLQMMKQSALGLLSPRVDGEAKKIVNRTSLLSHFSRR